MLGVGPSVFVERCQDRKACQLLQLASCDRQTLKDKRGATQLVSEGFTMVVGSKLL